MQNTFRKLIKGDRLSHSYLLFGRPDMESVRSLANFLERGSWRQPVGALADFMEVAPNSQSSIGIDEVKKVSRFLWQKPFFSARRTAVISQAELLTLAAQNALLKIAEEPPAHSLLFLLVSNPDILAPTLTSRFQKLYLALPYSAKANEEASAFLKASPFRQRAIIREVAGDNLLLERFVKGLMSELDKDPVKNLIPLRDLCRRWEIISRYNTNKKLQLEAWLQSFIG